MRAAKRLYNSFLLAMAILATGSLGTSCMDGLSDQYDLSEGVVKLIPFTVTASTPQDTKATVDYVQQQIFEEDDQLYIESVDGKLTGMLKIKSGGAALAKFEGTLTYTGSGDEPDPNLVLNARLISKNDKIGDKTFVGGIASKMTDAVSQFSTLTGTSTYEKKRFSLNQGTAFVDFSVTFDPAPDDDFYDAELTISGGEISLGTAEVTVLGGNARFALAFPDGTTLDRAKVTLCGKEFKFGGTGNTLEAAKIYKVNKTYSDDLNTPLTLEADNDGVITITIPSRFAEEYPAFSGIYYSKNGSTPWSQVTQTTSIPVSKGDKVCFYGNNSRYSIRSKFEPDDCIAATITCSQSCYVYGNIMSLVNMVSFATEKILTDNGTFMGLFNGLNFGGNHIVNHSVRKLVLPATTLSDMCYASMFTGCVDLTAIPNLTVQDLPFACYAYMFAGCTSLTSVPDFSMTSLDESCMQGMFSYCTGLKNAPALQTNANMADYCFSEMFRGCTQMETAPELPCRNLADGCYWQMFTDCSSLSTAPELPAETLASSCYSYMFRGCTSLTSAPELPAQTLTYKCYYEMFKGCTSLNYIKCLATDISAENCTTNWVDGVAPAGTFVEAEGMTDWELNSVNGIPIGWREPEPLATPLTLESRGVGVIKIHVPSNAPSSYNPITCVKNGTQTYTAESGTTSINVIAGDKVSFYGQNETYLWNLFEPDDATIDNFYISCTDPCYIYGNVMSLITPTDFKSRTDLTEGFSLGGLFCNKAEGNRIQNHPDLDLYLPATTLSMGCYYCMFGFCTDLVKAPALPAMTMKEGCYFCMFYGCPSLTLVPDLKARIMETGCYSSMFQGCTGLVQAPAIHAETLAEVCFRGMFRGCSALLYAPSLGAEMLASRCYQAMFKNCTSLVNPPALPATNLAENCYYEMFYNCTSLTSIPELPATALKEGCYYSMFHNCDGLTTAPINLPATTLARECYTDMFRECNNLVTVPNLPALVLANSCYQGMFLDCTSLTTAPSLPATQLANNCYSSMFARCTGLTAAPDLLAPTAASGCYWGMFNNCTNLSYIKCLTKGISTSSDTNQWVSGVAANGTFVRSDEMDWTTGANGIPEGWTVQTESTPNVHAVTSYLTNCTLSLPAESIADGNSYTTDIVLGTGYSLVAGSVRVLMGGIDITNDCYHPDQDVHRISIANVTGDIEITATGTLTGFTIAKNLTNVSDYGYQPIVDAGAPFSMGLLPSDGYVIVSVVVTMGGNNITSTAYDENTQTVSIGSVTGNVVITAMAAIDPSRTFSVTYNLTNATPTNEERYVIKGGIYTTRFTYTGNTLDINITMGGVDVTGQFWRSGDSYVEIYPVTGDLVITATGKNYYSVYKNLQKSSLSPDVTRVEEGHSFATEVVPESGYAITSVSVTMGATPVDCYDATTHRINIPSVTDNLSITVQTIWEGSTAPVDASEIASGISQSNTSSTANVNAPYSNTLTGSSAFKVKVWMSDNLLFTGTASLKDKKDYTFEINISTVTGPIKISATYK